MKRLIFALITLMFLQQARAQFQASFSPAMCPWQMQPASGAYDQNDEEDRLKRQERELKKRLKAQQKKMEKIDKRLSEYQEKIDRRLQPQISSKVIEHIQLGGNPADYHRDCATQTAPSAGSTASGVPLPTGEIAPANPRGTAQSEVAQVPADPMCTGPVAAAWTRNIQANGRVNSGICRESSEHVVRAGSSSAASSCVDALNGYMSLYEQRRLQEKRLAEARSDLDDLEFGDGDSEIEGDCVNCNKRGNSLSTASGGQWMNLLGTVLQVGVPALQNYLTNRSWQKTYRAAHTYEVDNCSRLGYPSYMCYGRYSLAQRYLGHYQRPYPSPMPGYFGSYGGMYGAVPGGMGTGAFGCQPGGFNSMGMPTLGMGGGGFGGAPGVLPMPGGGGGFGGAPGILPYPGGGAPPYIGGQGPWGGTPFPSYNGGLGYQAPGTVPIQGGSPGYNPYLLNSELNLINSRMGGSGYAPPVLPYPGGGGTNFPGGPLPSPVVPYNGIGGSFYNVNGGTVMYGSGVINGR